MKKSLKITAALMLIAVGSFAFNAISVDYITFCHKKMGGPGLCVQNGNQGFKCNPVEFLGDCEGTYAMELPPPTEY